MLKKVFNWTPCKRRKEKKQETASIPSFYKVPSLPQYVQVEPPVFLNERALASPGSPTDGALSLYDTGQGAGGYTPVPIISPSISNDQADRPPSFTAPSPVPPTTDIPQTILEGAKNFTIENSILTNVHGNAMIFKFDGGPPNEEFKAIFTKHLAGLVTVQDLDKVEKHILTQAIRALPRADAAYNDYTSRDKRRTTCFEGTRQALLEEMATWVIDRDNSPVYLLFGPAGMGKSTVAHTIAARADNLRSLGASFFFSRNETDRRNAKRFFTSIAFQLCAFDGQFAEAIGKALTDETGAAAQSKEPLEQLKRLILDPLRPAFSQRSLHVLIVVDALDECEEEDGQIILKGLDLLVKELRSFKVILTTRPQPYLQHLVRDLVAHKVFHLQNIEDKVIDGDIRLYLTYNLSRDQVQNLLPELEPWGASDREIEALVQAVGRLFIIASTAILFILDKAARDPPLQMEKLLNAFAHDRTPLNALNNFYTVILRNAVPHDSDPDLVERYQVVIGTIVTLQEPLPIGALAILTGLSTKSIHAVLVNLQSVILVGGSDSVPRIYHKSFPDYVTDPRRCKERDLLIVPREHHTRIATQCLRLMNRRLRRNILGLDGPMRYLNNDEVLEEKQISADQLREKIPEDLRYACAYWASHTQMGNSEDSALTKEMKEFAEEHTLHWFEALSWTQSLDVAHHALGIILKLLRSTSEMRDIFSDAFRFSSRYFRFIQQSALHAYHSSISFTPTGSRLYKRYHKTANSLCEVEGGPTEWDPIIAVLSEASMDTVTHIVFSRDSTRVASWTEGTIKIWDAASGTPIRIFKGDKIALSGDFSVAAVAHETQVMTYNVASKAAVGSFAHDADVVEIALSFNGSRIAVGLSDGTVSLWDTGTEKVIAILESYTRNSDYETDDEESGAGTVAESDGGEREVEDGAGESIQEEGEGEEEEGEGTEEEGTEGEEREGEEEEGEGEEEEREEEEGEEREQTEGQEEQDEHEQAPEQEAQEQEQDNDDGDTGSDEETQSDSNDSNSSESSDGSDSSEDEGSEGSDKYEEFENLRTLMFSPSGDSLAFVSAEGIKLWNSDNGELAYSLDHESHPVAGFVFSGDGSLLASVTYTHRSLRVWDSKSGELLGISKGLGLELLMNADGSLLAAEDEDGKVQLWSVKPFSLVETLDVKVKVMSLAFSNDFLAISSADDDSVTLYDLKTHAQVAELQIPNPSSLALSPDSTRIATGNSWNEVHLLDVPSIRALIDTSHKEWRPIHALTFSPDSSRLAAGFHDGTVELWDASKPAHIIASHKLHDDDIFSLAFLPDGERFASGSRDKTVRFWVGEDGSPTPNSYSSVDRIIALACSSDLLAVATKDNITLWNHRSSQLADTLPQTKANPILFSSDGSRLAATDNHLLTCMVWDVEQRAPIAAFTLGSSIEQLIFSPDNSRLASWLEKGHLSLFDIVNNNIIEDMEREDLGWIPHLNGIPIWYRQDEGYEISLVGWFSKHRERVPILRIPRDVVWGVFAAGPSIFAMGCADGRILFVRPTTNTRNY